MIQNIYYEIFLYHVRFQPSFYNSMEHSAFGEDNNHSASHNILLLEIGVHFKDHKSTNV